MASPAKFNGGNPSFLNHFNQQVDQLTEKANPFSEEAKQAGTIPFYQTGARAFIKVGGKAIAVCQSLTWQIQHQPNPIYTIDTTIPWDIDVGPMTVNAVMNRIIDPTKGPEVDFLLPIMATAVHQPMVELQVLDKLGTSIFFARGMFLSVNGNISFGKLSSITAQFTGVAYQHYVAQQFKPYNGIASGLSGLANGLKNLTGSFGL